MPYSLLMDTPEEQFIQTITGHNIRVPKEIYDRVKGILRKDVNREIVFILRAMINGYSNGKNVALNHDFNTNETFFFEGANTGINALEQLYGE